ncbi:hypothetical protein [Solibacillus sp. NPDC093137]|uniref:hypothetical protein n=1 Tax=Solibacillus sp. NPDC093137 TaxID=3390678 RepID=UPI003CFE9EF3
MTKTVTKENINDLIEEWHENDDLHQELHEFLGLTWEQYAHWVKTDELPTE